MGNAETDARVLTKQDVDTVEAEELKDMATKVLDSIREAEELLGKARENTLKMVKDCATNDALKGYDEEFAPVLTSRSNRTQSKLERIKTIASNAKEKALRKIYAEMDSQRG